MEGPDGMGQLVMAQIVLFLVTPVMLGLCYPPQLILDLLDVFFLEFELMGGYLDSMWVVFRE